MTITSVFSFTMPINAKASTADTALKKYKAVYEKEQQEEGLKKKVTFIYLDGDSVPEMILSNDDSTDEAQPEVFTYYNGKVSSVFLADYIGGTCYASEIKYVKKKGVISMSSMPFYNVHLYMKLKKGKFSKIAFLSDDDESGLHETNYYQIGNGKRKTIKHSAYKTYEKKFNKKYAKGAKKIKMYSSFDAAKKAL